MKKLIVTLLTILPIMSTFAQTYGDMDAIRALNKEQRFFNMDYKQAEQFMVNWKIED